MADEALAEEIAKVLATTPPSRRELQRVAKLAGIRANAKSALIIEQLQALVAKEPAPVDVTREPSEEVPPGEDEAVKDAEPDTGHVKEREQHAPNAEEQTDVTEREQQAPSAKEQTDVKEREQQAPSTKDQTDVKESEQQAPSAKEQTDVKEREQQAPSAKELTDVKEREQSPLEPVAEEQTDVKERKQVPLEPVAEEEEDEIEPVPMDIDSDEGEKPVMDSEARRAAMLRARSARSAKKAADIRQAKKISNSSGAYHRAGPKNIDRPTKPLNDHN
ncbi:hypothetical protein CTAYLR_005293 [Chrysophaeum taylorii]|uniref:Uncharacterized protein n=1 Tax=Chrysophaeum taylorii TaxID=2483200 RepID=A0AAD7XLC3_9STRA|nr:hypothetical protein CTAYLR_005293 [Chrysophaeum taylorii]